MDCRVFEVLLSGDNYVFGFAGFDDWEDFDHIMEIIEGIIKPIYCDWGGMEDMHGFFDKDGVLVEVEFNSMMGNFLVYKGERTETNLRKVREWAQIIFDNLMSHKDKR